MQWRNLAPLILSTEFNGTRSCAHARKTILLAPIHSFTRQIVATFIVSSIIDLRFFAIGHTCFSTAPYKLSITFLRTRRPFLSHLFVGFLELVHVNPRTFFKLSFCAFICLCNNTLSYFLMDFSQIFISTSPMYALPVILFSACKIYLNLFVIGY